VSDPHARNVGVAFGALLASSTTLVCCVLPALLVSIGAGAAVAGLVSAVPQLVWISEQKTAVFGIAAAILAATGFALWRARSLPCPADPVLARTCERLRRTSGLLYGVSVVTFAVGAAFAFGLPVLAG
jgi:hypothetical protein